MIQKKHQLAINTVCVTAALTAYTSLNHYLAPQLITVWWAAPLLSGIASLGSYAALVTFLQWLYDNYIEDFLIRKISLAGKWYYILEINGQDTHRIGKCTISRDDGSLYLSGTHFHPSKKVFTSNFSSEAFQIDYPRLYVRYIAQGIRDKELDKSEGVFFLQTEGEPPSKIHGTWSDVVPARNTGSITLLRESPQVEQRMRERGYPVGISEVEKVFGQTPR
jgi:hypothetical protein